MNNYSIKFLKYFKQQFDDLDEKSRQIIYKKIQLIKENPFRFKKIHSKVYSKVFRVRLNLKSKETRLIYSIINPNIILVCLLDRKKYYRDLEKYLSKI
jgi:mRNA-degrading endonuclease RelE of RelBE toxin-antitoxin system